MLSTIVRIDRNVRGAWDVLSDQGEHLTCKTLDEAQYIAKEFAARISEFGGLPTTVRIDRNVRGAWDVVSDQGEHLTCRTLDEAQQVAERLAAGIRPCETLSVTRITAWCILTSAAATDEITRSPPRSRPRRRGRSLAAPAVDPLKRASAGRSRISPGTSPRDRPTPLTTLKTVWVAEQRGPLILVYRSRLPRAIHRRREERAGACCGPF
jgi:hypothetical protein